MKNSITPQTSSPSGLQSDWVKHLRDPEEREAFKKLILNNSDHPILKRLFLILDDRLTKINNSQTESNYTTSAWAYKLAHTNGERQMLREVLDLLSFIDGPKK